MRCARERRFNEASNAVSGGSTTARQAIEAASLVGGGQALDWTAGTSLPYVGDLTSLAGVLRGGKAMLPLLRQKLAYPEGGEATAAELAQPARRQDRRISPRRHRSRRACWRPFPANVRDELSKLVEFGTLQFQEPEQDDGLPVPVDLDVAPEQQSVLPPGIEAPEIVEGLATAPINPPPFAASPPSERGSAGIPPKQLAKGAGKAVVKTAVDVGTGMAGATAGEVVGQAIGGETGANIGRVAGAVAAPAARTPWFRRQLTA